MTPEERAWLDAQYNNRARVPNFQAHLDAWSEDSAAVRGAPGAILDIAYGESERQAIDLFRPPHGRPPLLVFIHGGYWQALNRKLFSFVARPFVAAGVAVAVIGYDLAPEVRIGGIVGQIRRALVFLHRQGPALEIDADRLVVSGHSAGGHLAAMALATRWQEFAAAPNLVRGVVALSGLFDLEPIRQSYLNEVLGLEPDEIGPLSPIHLAPESGPVPVLVAVGGAESEAFLEQSRRYADHLRQHGQAVEHRIEAGLDHFEIAGRFGRAGHPLAERALVMLER